jgi:hypothetical protein
MSARLSHVPSKRGVIVLVVAVALVVAGALLFTSSSDSDYPSYKTDAVAGRRLARDACRAFTDFVALVNKNGSSKDGMALLDRFRAKAQAAYDEDVQWTRLMSAAQSLRAGFKADDPTATRAGYDVGRAECRRV